MRVGRLILVVATIVTIMVFPLLMHEALEALQLPSAYAAPNIFDTGGRVYQNGNNGDDDDDDEDDGGDDNDDETDNEGEDNENEDVECYLNLNDNEPVPCDFEDNDNGTVYYPPTNDNGDGGYVPPPAPPQSAPSGRASASQCYGSSEAGTTLLDTVWWDVRLTVVPPGQGSQTRITLTELDPATVPGPPSGTSLLDAAVWQIDVLGGCDGAAMGMFPAAANLGFEYAVSADKSKLQIVRLEGGVWVEVPTSLDPDPNKPYISATIQNAGTYAVIQKP